MAIIEDILSTDENGVSLIKRYSDQGFLLLQLDTGEMYGEAIDLNTANKVYEETDIPMEKDNEENESIDEEDNSEIEEKAKAFDILMGVSE